MESLGIYVQVPFCASKCTFCNFSSQVVRTEVYKDYVRALCREVEQLPESYQAAGIDPGLIGMPADTLYFGGGTPSLLGAELLGDVLAALRRRITFAPEVEFTLEMTPGSEGSQFLRRARALGVNRLSIGAQSFDDRELRAVGRLHSAADTRELLAAARAAGFRNISVDLIAGVPYQSEISWHASLRAALALRPEHLSVYILEIDEKSRLGGEILKHGIRYHARGVPSEDFMAEAYETARAGLCREGYVHYEISNFALPARQSVHNLKYWQSLPYIGLGAGAHSFDGRRRWENDTSTQVYEGNLARGASPICTLRALSDSEQIAEFFFLGLRQRAGIDLALADERWGPHLLTPWKEKIEALEGEGWLERVCGRLRLADRALLVSNEIFQQFITA